MELMGLVPGLVKKDTKSEPVIVHNCKVPKEEDVIATLYPGKSVLTRITRWVTRKRVMSSKHHYAETCLKSNTAIQHEIGEHMHQFPYMIHPFSPINNCWSMFMTVMTLILLTVTPVLNAFYFESHWNSLPILVGINLVMLFDVGLRFFTGFFEKKTKSVVLDPVLVATNYLKGWFALDLASALPVEFFDYLSHGKQHESWWCSLFNFMKIFRIRNLLNYIGQFRRAYHISFQKSKILELAITICLNLHWAACLVYYVPIVVLEFSEEPYRTSQHYSINDERRSWILSAAMSRRDSQTARYFLCLNRATISLISAAHYLDVATTEDMIMNFILAVWGKLGYIYILSQLLVLMSTFKTANKERAIHLKQLREYIQSKELPIDTQKRLVVYYNYWNKKNINRDSHILGQVSEPLREELTLHNYQRLLETVDLFKYLPRKAIVQLVKYVKPKICLLNDEIVRSGTKGEHLYFIASGTVAVFNSAGKEICHMEDGSYFGETALVMENEHRVADVVAIETCELLTIPREAFLIVIAPYPNLLIRLQKVAIERLEKSVMLDDIDRLGDPSPQYINISNFRGKIRE